MGSLIDKYNRIISTANELSDKITSIETEIQKKSSDNVTDIAARIENLKSTIEKIDEYLLKVRAYQELAKMNLDSQNILTIEAPPGYRVNLNKLNDWSKMIDPSSSNDPYAQRVLSVAKCDEKFLLNKREEFTARIEELSAGHGNGEDQEVVRLKGMAEAARGELKQYIMSEEVVDFAKDVVKENERYWFKNDPISLVPGRDFAEYVSPGACAAPFVYDKESVAWLKSLMGECFDADGGRVLLPYTIENKKEYVMLITCSVAKRNKIDQVVQNMLLETFASSPAGMRRVYVIDAVRFSSASIRNIRGLEDTSDEKIVIERIPRNQEQLTSALEQIVSTTADMDDILEQYDSVSEYNYDAPEEKRIPFTTLVLYGWPEAFDGRDKELVQRIMTNYERYGISIIAITYQNSGKEETADYFNMPNFAFQNAIRFKALRNESTVFSYEETPQQFTWYGYSSDLPESYISSVKEHYAAKKSIGNEYTKRYSVTNIPEYVREYKEIRLPFGIDGKDNEQSISFENENFATYLVGASRSGKSTLLHTLIAGLIRNYHPDNVELWLADFKQLEFKRYIDHLPPHVKYVLLDESTELVFDLIDKLTDIMMDRQKLFSRLGVDKLHQLNPIDLEKPLPVIFVILDEFSIMSQSISESPAYKLKLQNLLAKGAALGIKFLFSSQTFTSGVTGLSSTARAQIQQRIAMKGSREEISETLELSTALKTEQVKNWMDALPPHYALIKFRQGADALPLVKRYLVMYFKDYAPRDAMIDQISNSMKAVDTYDPTNIQTYVNKKPVLVDGNSYEVFENESCKSALKTRTSQFRSDCINICFGVPRLMERVKTVQLSNETRENILLCSRLTEEACTASIILSAIKSCVQQNCKVTIWAYGKNALFLNYKRIFKGFNIRIVEDLEAVSEDICALRKRLISKESSNELIIMLGMERICMDFEYLVDEEAEETPDKESAFEKMRQKFANNGAIVSSEEEERKRRQALEWLAVSKVKREEYKKSGKTSDEITELLRKDYFAFIGFNAESKEVNAETENEKKDVASNNQVIIVENKEKDVDLENAKTGEKRTTHLITEYFNFVIKQGSRLGYHFLLNLSSFSDLKQCGLKRDYFRHRMAFQMSAEESRNLFDKKIASSLPEHICQYDDTITQYSFRPYLHRGVGWDGWSVTEDNKVINPYGK